MIDVVYTRVFRAWLDGLQDRQGRIKIGRRIERLRSGNPGDHRGVGEGLMEMRIAFGPGYRVYYKSYGTTVVVLLAGGDKSTQATDIAKAKAAAIERERSRDGR